MHKGCCIINCPSQSSLNFVGVTFHRFPNKSATLKRWVDSIRSVPEMADWMPSGNELVCSKHFLTSDFEPGRHRVLKRLACPTVFLDNSHFNLSVGKRKQDTKLALQPVVKLIKLPPFENLSEASLSSPDVPDLSLVKHEADDDSYESAPSPKKPKMNGTTDRPKKTLPAVPQRPAAPIKDTRREVVLIKDQLYYDPISFESIREKLQSDELLRLIPDVNDSLSTLRTKLATAVSTVENQKSKIIERHAVKTACAEIKQYEKAISVMCCDAHFTSKGYLPTDRSYVLTFGSELVRKHFGATS